MDAPPPFHTTPREREHVVFYAADVAVGQDDAPLRGRFESAIATGLHYPARHSGRLLRG